MYSYLVLFHLNIYPFLIPAYSKGFISIVINVSIIIIIVVIIIINFIIQKVFFENN